ncbi:uncharacterized protein [Hyperolius riggenbachi]|uniref:uncharacterized protein n=1 Tax=Hyperolius riggenbachi TaxID=752182 RepID=UPI0035A2BA9F
MATCSPQDTHIQNSRTIGDLLCDSLEDLKEQDFRRFKDKLSDFSFDDLSPVPRGRVENADCIATKNCLIDTYGGKALELTVYVLKLVKLMGPAEDLQKKADEKDTYLKNLHTIGGLLCDSLEDLKEQDFKRFKDKLSDFSFEDFPPIPRGRVENADCIATKKCLIDTYGEKALEATLNAFKLLNLMGPAEVLQKNVNEKDAKINSKKNIKEKDQSYEECNARLGESVKLGTGYRRSDASCLFLSNLEPSHSG